jgi:hypothetical protein
MDKNPGLTLEQSDPRVVAALKAEQQLFAYYKLETKIHFIRLPDSGLRIRVIETK